MKTESLPLSSIRLDGGTQCRASLDQDHIATLADAWQDGAKMPAVVVFHDGSNYWLADGFHRYHAAQKCEFRDIEAEVRSGTRCDAVKFALGANAAHGLRRTNADKRRAVEIALKEFPKLSSRELAKVCAVGDDLVNDMRKQLPENGSSARTGADGKERKMPTPAKKPEPSYAPPARLEIVAGNVEDEDSSAAEAPAAQPSKPAPREIVVPFVVPPQRSQQAQPAAKSGPYVPPARGLMMARGAISHLEEIPAKDAERIDAIKLVLAWCNSQLSN